MDGVHRIYTDEVYEKLGFLACWLPNTKVALGDVGTVAGRRFERATSLAELGVAFGIGEPSRLAGLEYLSAGKIEVTVEGAGAAGPTDGRVSIRFGEAGATFIQAARCRWETVTNHPALERELQVLRAAGQWRPDWVVVTKVLRTGPVAIMVSSAAGTTVDLRLSADVLSKPLPVANGSAGLSASSRSGLAAVLAVRGGATPFFGAMTFRRALPGRVRLRWRSGETEEGGASDASELEEVGWDRFAGVE